MHCWKTFNVDKKYQFYRQFFISSLITLLVFITFYVPIQILAGRTMEDSYFALLVTGVFLLYPLHKFMHYLPLAKYSKSIKLEIDFYFYVLPIINLKIDNPVPKLQFAISLILPFLLINSGICALMFLFPEYVHYLTILLAYHFGLCAGDLPVLKALLLSPRHSLVEEHERGYQILVNE